MAFNESLGQRIGQQLAERGADFQEKRMFGGLCFMVHDKMCCGIVKEDLMLRVLEDKYEQVLEMPHVREMDFTHRPMKGFVYVDPAGVETDAQLGRWLDFGLEFAKMGKLKTKKK